MASIDLEYNSGFQIYNSDDTPFHDLVLHKCTYETVVMSLGDKISGILYYKDNALDVTMSEYIIYKGVRYTLVNPPTILREGLVSDNSELRGMTKYSFTFYHPMYVLNNFPFSDIAVQSGQSRYLSQNKTFSWIGTLVDFVAKLNKNLEDTQWMVTIGNVTQEEQTKLSEVLSFDKNTIAEALKRGYETWEVPYVVDQLTTSSPYYPKKRFVVQYGLPTTEILDEYNQPFVFQMGQGVGLKNNSRNPKNNKIITRIAGYGSEDNIPYGYPQIPYYGGNVQYPLYYGIVDGQRVQLIKHPFTRNHLMPSVYSQSVYNKVNPKLSDGSNNPNYKPNIELVDYYDANDNTYTNRIKPNSPSYEIHEFGDIKPELGDKSIISAVPVSQQETQPDYKQKSDFLQEILDRISATEIEDEKTELLDVYDRVDAGLSYYEKHGEEGGDTYWFVFSITRDDYYEYVSYESSNYNFTATVLRNGSSAPTPDWDDTMDDDGNYLQSYFKITLPILEFDLYACAAITQEMKINMRSGACIGCTFPVEVDWDDYKRNFYNSDGEFAPQGEQRDYTKYPDSSSGQITVMVKKELETFGTLMPNQYQQPTTGDKFVILGISLPNTYITSAEQRLDTDMKQYMRDNNVYYYDYPLKFDEHFLISHEDILSQMKNNVVVRFKYADEEQPKALYIKQMSVKYNESPLPKYDITLTDDIEIVLNQIGQVTDEVSKLRLGFGAGGFGTVGAEYIRKDIDDTARGTIRMIKGMQVGERFVTGLLGEGGVFRKDSDGTTYLETDKLYVRMKAYFDTVEVKHYLHTGGNRIASQASGIVCSRVEMIDAHNNLAMDVADAVLFRCFFKANDGDKTIRNDFMIGDLAFCRETNVDVISVNLHGYWRLVIGRNVDGFLTENKEAWIDLSNRASDTITIGGRQYSCAGYQNGSDAPIAQDDIIQLGNIADKDRQGAIVEYVGGEDAPSYQIFQGIGEDLPYPYTLEDKNYIGLGYSSQTGHAYMNVYGDVFIGAKPDSVTGESPTYIKYAQEDPETGEPKLTIKAVVEFQSPDDPQTTTTLDDFARLITGDIENIQSQIDGEIDTWFYAGIPTLQNAPANEWTTDAEKEKHTGDLYYDIGTGADAGKAYRFVRSQTTPYVYSWQYIDDTAITEALRIAAHAQDTADHKRRVFVTQPLPPYDIGDLWSDAVYPSGNTEKDSENGKYYKDLLTCKVAKEEGESFNISDWGLTTNYTDDSSLINFIDNTYTTDKTNLQQQIDGKAETWYQDDDPSSAWTTAAEKAKHIGDLWSDTSANGGKKTYIWKDFGTSANPRYAWAEQAVPDEVFDKIDGKSAIYTNTFAAHPVDYSENDLWILPAAMTINGTNYKRGEVLTAICNYSGTNTWQADWTKKVCYTDDTELFTFINGAYATTIQSLNDQIDQKADTYYQDTDPSLESGWDASEHVGDLWYRTTDSTTWYYKDNGASASPRYSWVEQDVPDSVFDKIDGKSSIFVTQPSNYKANDLWILAADTTVNNVAYKQGEVLTASQDSQSFNQSHWSKKVRYTDDSSLTTFLNGTYSTDKANLQTQIDQKAETWYQSTDPSLAWTTPELRALHVGDLWHNSSNTTVSNIEAGMDAMWNGTSWAPSEVPQEVYDKIDGKADIFVSKPTTYNRNDLWIIESGIAATDIPSGCQVGDIVIADNMPSDINSRGSYIKGDWRKKDRYTDDSYAHEFDYLKTAMKGDTSIQGGLLLSNTIVLRNLDTSTTPATITDIMSGINGVLNTSLQDPLKSIAAWYGGEMKDYETLTDAQKNQGWSVQKWAKSLFRFDGSGYLASNNIRWTSDGKVYLSNLYTGNNSPISNLFFDAFAIGLDGTVSYINPQFTFNHMEIVRRTGVGDTISNTSVLNYGEMKARFVTLDFFNALFSAFSVANPTSSTTPIDPSTWTAQTVINNLKINVGTWTNEYLSALGLNSSSSGGGDVYWTQLTENNPSQQIHPSHLSSVTQPLYFLFNDEDHPTTTYDGKVNRAVSGILTKTYADARYYQKIANGSSTEVVLADGTKSSLKTINGNNIFGTGDIVISGGGGSTGNYVTISGTDTITGQKIFTRQLTSSVTSDWASKFESTNCGIWCSNNSGHGILIDSTSTTSSVYLLFIRKGSTSLGSNGTTVLRVNADGNIGIGEDYPSYPLTVNGTVCASSYIKTGGVQMASVNDNVASATKLASQVSLWGQPFDGSGNVNGSISVTGLSSGWAFLSDSTNCGVYLNYSAGNGILITSKRSESSTYVAQFASNCPNIGSITGGTVGLVVKCDGTSSFGGLIDITSNSNTVTIGSADSGYCHFFNSADIPFFFNKSIILSGNVYPYTSGDYTLGTVSFYWKELRVNDIYLRSRIYGMNDTQIFYNNQGLAQLYISKNYTILGYDNVNNELPTYIDGYDIHLRTGANWSNHVIITNSGNFGIGTTSPSYKLHVSGTLGVANQITSTLASGTAPISVTSTTVCTNLNADLLDGSHASDFLRIDLSSIELNMYGSLQGYGGFFDFHYNGSTADYTSRIIEDQSGRLNINSVIYAHLGGRVSINTTATSGILTVSRGSTNDYAIDTIGQQRYKYDSGDTSNLSIGLFSSNKCPFIRFTDVLGGYIDVQMVPVVDSGGTVTDSLFSIGKTSHTSRVIARNFRVYTRISSDDSGNTQAMQALMNGRLLVGSANTTLVNGNTDCKFLVNGNMCTSADNGSFIKIGSVYLIYDSDNNAIKVAGNAAGTAAANFYSMGAVSALGANTSGGGGGTTEYVTLSTGQAISGAKTFTTNVQMSADLIPSMTNQYYVGTSGRTFLGLYVKNATITGTMEVGGITYLCSRAFQFSASTDGGGHTLSTISTNGRSLRIELGSSALNPYVSKPWTEGSDIRRKDVIANASTSVDNVANAPVFNFRYKGDSVNSINLGTSAQYWRNVFPCGVSEMGDGYLAMNYGAIALASAVMVARRVQNHEDRIAYLERENEQLRNEIKQLKAA